MNCPNNPAHDAHEGPCPCDYWVDLTLDLQDLSHVEDIELLDFPTMSCRLLDGHVGPHQLKLDQKEA